MSSKQILKKNIKDGNTVNETTKLVSSESFATFEQSQQQQQQQQNQLNQIEHESGKKSIAESYKTVRKMFDKVATHDDKSERSNHLDAENLNDDKSVAKSTSNYKVSERGKNRLSFKAIGKLACFFFRISFS
jgi:multidrug efflux pump subunit AcrA (membrane-fusion protein)